MAVYETLSVERGDRRVVITVDRPEAANGINAVMAGELADVAGVCDRDRDLKAVVWTGRGRFFCAGGDVEEVAGFGEPTEAGVKSLADDLHRAVSSFARMRAPVIVAVNGTGAGAGFSLAVAGDLVLAADTARFTMSYADVGLSPDGSSSWYLPRLIGLCRTQELMFTNRVLTAPEALEWGLLTRVVPPGELMSTAQELAASLVAGPGDAHATIKKLLLSSYDHVPETQVEIEGRAISACAGIPNGREGIAAFTQCRSARFTSTSPVPGRRGGFALPRSAGHRVVKSVASLVSC